MDRGLRPKTLLFRALRKIIAAVAVAGVVGLWIGYFWPAVAVALALCMVQHLRFLVTLRRWLERPKLVELPITSGIWADVFDGLLILQKRNRKRKRRLAAILSEFQASTAALPDGAVVLGLSGEIIWFNQAAQALLGLRQPQDLGLRIPNLVRKPSFTEYFARTDYSGEVEAGSPINAAVTLAFRIIPYGNDQRLMIVRDISDLRRLEQARRDFVANASHELRTPLTVLRGYLDVMEPESRTDGPLATWAVPIREMRNQASRMESLINDLLKLARLESDVIQTRQDLIDIPRVLARVREEAKAISQGGHQLLFDIQPDLWLYGRESEIQSVFMNLIANAIQYTQAGGTITTRWWGDENGANFQVVDTGIGISEKDLQRVTERFYRVDVGRSRASGGTGLGLSIVKHALENHEGRLAITSELGVGSTFLCHFPPHRIHRGSLRNELKTSAG
jgi:two-component system, OmpR family, phosphate regulon sensor histidine kinase PhoR